MGGIEGARGRLDAGAGGKNGMGSSSGAGRGAAPAPQASGVADGTGPTGGGGGGLKLSVPIGDGPAGDGTTSVGAPAACDSSEVGTETAAWQNGHFTFFPDDSSRARKRFPQEWQPRVIGIMEPAE